MFYARGTSEDGPMVIAEAGERALQLGSYLAGLSINTWQVIHWAAGLLQIRMPGGIAGDVPREDDELILVGS